MGGEHLEENNKFALYFHAYAGALGLVLLIVTIIKYYEAVEFSSSYLLPFFGFILTVSYINYLESRAGISKKIIWIIDFINYYVAVNFKGFILLI